jgi:hypothetical protein
MVNAPLLQTEAVVIGLLLQLLLLESSSTTSSCSQERQCRKVEIYQNFGIKNALFCILLARKAMYSEVEIHQNFGVKNAPNIFKKKPVVL